MKKFLFIMVALFIGINNDIKSQPSNNTKANDDMRTVYLGLGTGINNYNGLLGFNINIRAYEKFFIQGGFGIGSWGTKLSVGLRYDKKYTKGWSYGIGYSYCSGLNDFSTELEIDSGNTKSVKLDLLPASTLNLKMGYHWIIRKSNEFYLEFGYAIRLQSEPWEVKDGSKLSETSKSIIYFNSPGGLILGIGFLFGL